MSADALSALLAANIAAGAAILLVILLRKPARRVLGARLAYWLWIVPVVVGAASLIPARPAVLSFAPAAPVQPLADATVDMATVWAAPPAPQRAYAYDDFAYADVAPPAPSPSVDAPPQPAPAPIDIPAVILLVWAIGAAGVLFFILLQQRHTLRALRLSPERGALRSAGEFGPAVVGVVRPRLVLPADFEERFSPVEQDLVLAHEHAHLASGDTRVNALIAVAVAFNWFNPLVHLAARLGRIDQELACDAAVIARHPADRGAYAEALLKTQLGGRALPLGCTWPSRSSRLFKERMTMLARKSPGRIRRIGGAGLLSAIALSAGLVAWAQSSGGVSQLMPRPTPEEEALKTSRQTRMFAEMAKQNPNDPLMKMIAAGPGNLPMTGPHLWRSWLHDMIRTLDADYPAPRTIPEGKMIEVSVSVRTPQGEALGPYPMLSSFASGYRHEEMANGSNQAVPAKPPAINSSGFADFFPDSDVMYHQAAGDGRFLGAILGSVDSQGLIRMNFILILDGQPTRIIGAMAKSGASAQVNTPSGYRLTLSPVLRDLKPVEARWHNLAKLETAEREARIKAGLNRAPDGGPGSALNALVNPAMNRPPPRPSNPDWPGPSTNWFGVAGSMPWRALANRRFECGEWKSRFSNDPKVDVSKIGASPVKLSFDGAGRAQIDPPTPSGAFAPDAFPNGLAATQVLTTFGDDSFPMPGAGMGNALRRIGRSPTLADVLDFNELDQPSPTLVWERIRKEQGVIYRTRFFVGCKKA